MDDALLARRSMTHWLPDGNTPRAFARNLTEPVPLPRLNRGACSVTANPVFPQAEQRSCLHVNVYTWVLRVSTIIALGRFRGVSRTDYAPRRVRKVAAGEAGETVGASPGGDLITSWAPEDKRRTRHGVLGPPLRAM